jgi:histidine triad (HIT) family protein
MKTIQSKNCVFCKIANAEAPADIVYDARHFMAFTPLNPVTPGHTLVIPKSHYEDASANTWVTGLAAEVAAIIAVKPYNLIINCGVEASQTVMHLHWHVVPRRAGDGLLLPWTNQVVS